MRQCAHIRSLCTGEENQEFAFIQNYVIIRTDKCNKEHQLINLLAGTNILISKHPQNK